MASQNGTMQWIFHDGHTCDVDRIIPRRDIENNNEFADCIPLACSLPCGISCKDRLFPPKYSTGKQISDAQCNQFRFFIQLVCMLKQSKLVKYFLLEELGAEEGGEVIGHRFVVGVHESSTRVVEGFLGRKEMSTGGEDEDEDGASVGFGDNHPQGGGGRGSVCDGAGEEGDSGDITDNMSDADKIRLTIDEMTRSLFMKRSEVDKRKRGRKSKKAAGGGPAVVDEDGLHLYCEMLKMHMMNRVRDDEVGGGDMGQEEEERSGHLFSHNTNEKILKGDVKDAQYIPAQYGGYRLFSMMQCLVADDCTVGSRRHDLENDEVPRVMNRYKREQCLLSNYFHVCEDTHELDEFRGIVFPDVRCRYVMRVSPTHLKTGAFEFLPEPRASFENFCWRLKQRAAKRTAISMTAGNAQYMSKLPIMTTALNPTLVPRDAFIGVDGVDYDSALMCLPKPAIHFDASLLSKGATEKDGTVITDPVVLKQKYRYENPKDVAEQMCEDDKDIAHLGELRGELSTKISRGVAILSDIRELDSDIDEAEDGTARMQSLVRDHLRLVEENTNVITEVKRLHSHVENIACCVATKLIERTMRAAQMDDTDLLSEAQIACFKQGHMFKKTRSTQLLCISNRDLSPFGNWLQHLTLMFDEVNGIHTHHTQAIFLLMAAKTAFIAADEMRVHVIQSGAAMAGKDFLRECVQRLSPKGVFQSQSCTTEAARVDMARQLETGITKYFSENPSWLMPQQPFAGSGGNAMAEYIKKMITELLIERQKYVNYIDSRGEEVSYVTQCRTRARCVMFVNSNEHAGTSVGSSASHSFDAILSRFMRLPQAIPVRKMDRLQQGEVVVNDVDARLYTSGTCSMDMISPKDMAKRESEYKCHQAVGVHALVNLMVTAKVIPAIDMTVFEETKGRVGTILKMYYHVAITSRYIQQARALAYAMTIDDWWVKQYLLTSGYFVVGGVNELLPEEADMETEQCDDGDAQTEESLGRRMTISPSAFTRALMRCPPACTEEIMLYAWQMMLSSGVVSYNILCSMSVILSDYMKTFVAACDETYTLREPRSSVAEMFYSATSSDLEQLDCAAAYNVELFNGFKVLNWKASGSDKADNGKQTPASSALAHFCRTLYSHNLVHAVTDAKYSSEQMLDALNDILRNDIQHPVPTYPALEYRRKDADGRPVSVFLCEEFYVARLAEIYEDDHRAEEGEFVRLLRGDESLFVSPPLPSLCRKTQFFNACARALALFLCKHEKGETLWRGAVLMIDVVKKWDAEHVFACSWGKDDIGNGAYQKWHTSLCSLYDPATNTSVVERTTSENPILNAGLPEPLYIDWDAVSTNAHAIGSFPPAGGVVATLRALFDNYGKNAPNGCVGIPAHAMTGVSMNRRRAHAMADEVEGDIDEDVGIPCDDLNVVDEYAASKQKAEVLIKPNPQTKYLSVSTDGKGEEMLQIRIDHVLYWAGCSSGATIQEEFLTRYSHAAVKSRHIVAHVTKASTSASVSTEMDDRSLCSVTKSRGYDELKVPYLQKSEKQKLFSKNPLSVPRHVSARLISGITEHTREKWDNESVLLQNTFPVDEWAQSLRNPLGLGTRQAHKLNHPYVHLIDVDSVYGAPAEAQDERQSVNCESDDERSQRKRKRVLIQNSGDAPHVQIYANMLK